MKKALVLITGLIMTSFLYPSWAQTEALQKLTERYNRFHQQNLWEKIYLHTDRQSYLAGETIWFKIYNTDGYQHKPLDISTVAYVELLNTRSEPVLQAKIALDEGLGQGSFFIPLNLASGTFRLRAYTNWMKNAGVAGFFRKDINIVNTFKNLGEIAGAMSKDSVGIQFFGHQHTWVNGVPSNITVQVHPWDIREAVLLASSADTVAEVSFQQGVAEISLVPDPAEEYTLQLNHAEQLYIFALPEPAKIFADMKLNNAGKELRIMLAGDSVPGMVNLIFHDGEQVLEAKSLSITDGVASFSVRQPMIPGQIYRFALYNAEGNFIRDMLHFVKPDKKLTVEVGLPKQAFGLRERVEFNIRSMIDAQPVMANLSMSIHKKYEFEKEDFPEIETYLPLFSSLPDVYPDKVWLDMGNKLPTEGWSRYGGGLNGSVRYLPERNGMIVKGTITNRKTSEPEKFVRGYFSVVGKSARIFGGISDQEGHIFFEAGDFTGEQLVVIQTRDDSLYRFQMEDPFVDDTYNLRYRSMPDYTSHAEELRERSVSLQVQNSYYKKMYASSVASLPDTVSFLGLPDATYYLDDYTRFPTIEDVMREYVANVWVRKNRNGYYYLVYDQVNNDIFKNNSLVLLDGVPLFDVDQIMKYDPLLVKKVDVFKRRLYHGVLTFDGIVSYTSYTGNMPEFEFDSRIFKTNFKGLQDKRIFTEPDYHSEHLPDFRTLLLWDPEIITTSEGSYQGSFFTSDQPGNYIIEIQGITKNGMPGSVSYEFEVKENEVN